MWLCQRKARPPALLTFSSRQYKLLPSPERSHMTDRIRFISHDGKKILLVDFSNCSAAEVEKVCRAVPEVVTTLPLNSVLILSDYTGASFDKEAMDCISADGWASLVHVCSFLHNGTWVPRPCVARVGGDAADGFRFKLRGRESAGPTVRSACHPPFAKSTRRMGHPLRDCATEGWATHHWRRRSPKRRDAAALRLYSFVK